VNRSSWSQRGQLPYRDPEGSKNYLPVTFRLLPSNCTLPLVENPPRLLKMNDSTHQASFIICCCFDRHITVSCHRQSHQGVCKQPCPSEVDNSTRSKPQSFKSKGSL
jgi:hypothetical protein